MRLCVCVFTCVRICMWVNVPQTCTNVLQGMVGTCNCKCMYTRSLPLPHTQAYNIQSKLEHTCMNTIHVCVCTDMFIVYVHKRAGDK